MKYKAIFFDLDGTLIDSYLDIAGAANDLLVSRGLPPLDVPTFRRLIGNGMYDMLRLSFAEHDQTRSEQDFQQDLAEFRKIYMARSTKLTSVYPSVFETLETMKTAGISLSICTNKAIEATIPIVEHFGLQLPMDFIIGGDSLEKSKPDAMPLDYLMEQTGTEPSQVLMVGDSITDCLAAQAAGCDMALVTYGYRRHEIEELPFTHRCDRFDQLLERVGLG